MKTTKRPINSGSVLALLLVLAVMAFVFVASVAALVYSSVRPTSEFRDLQEAVADELPRKPNLQVAVRAPSVLVAMARTGLQFIDDVDDEARLAVQSVKGGQFGMYQLRGDVTRRHKTAVMEGADAAMARHEWQRVVAVIENDVLVLVYTPSNVEDPSDLRILAVVLNENELIIAGADGDLFPVYELARPHIEEARREIQREFH